MTPAGRLIFALAAAAMPVVAAQASAATAKPAARIDWTRTFAVTPAGGFRMGNPKAKVSLIEYGSLTCPHCRHFAQTGVKPLLQNYVRSGKVSYEYRSLVLDGTDLTATLVARCGGPQRFFPMAEKLYATQPQWVGRSEKLSDDDRTALEALPTGKMTVRLAQITGLFPVAAANGISPQRAQACLSNEAAALKLAEMYKAAVDSGVAGTPTFFVNGKKVDAADWTALEPFLKGAGG
jgi:protein-disulfide isomerase